jgi:hypothetical protein
VERKQEQLAMQQLKTPPGFSREIGTREKSHALLCFIHCMSYKVGAPKVANAKDDLVHVWVYWLTNT